MLRNFARIIVHVLVIISIYQPQKQTRPIIDQRFHFIIFVQIMFGIHSRFLHDNTMTISYLFYFIQITLNVKYNWLLDDDTSLRGGLRKRIKYLPTPAFSKRLFS